MGRPVIGTNRGGILDVIRDGENGILVPSENHHELAKSLVYILGSPNIAQKMGLLNYKYSMEYLSGREKAIGAVRSGIYGLMHD